MRRPKRVDACSLLKLLLVPLFLSIISLVSARFGPVVGGWLAGFPVVGGPILLFLSLERGADFAAEAAVLSLGGLVGAVVFSIAYAWASRRFHYSLSALMATVAWAFSALILVLLAAPLWPTFAAVVATLLLAPRCFPPHRAPASARALGRGELLLRMAAGASLMWSTTEVAVFLGPVATGVIAVFPVLTLVLAASTHRANGADFTTSLLRNMTQSLFSFAVFGLVLSLTLASLGTGRSFTAATLCAMLVHWAVRELRRPL